jgi:PAS domain S-box-containing protein
MALPAVETPNPQSLRRPSPLCLATVCGIALDTSPTANVIVDSAGMIWRASAELHRISGWPALGLDGQHISVLMPPGIKDTHPARFAEAFLHREKRHRVEYHRIHPAQILHRKGHLVPVQILVVEPPAGVAEELAIAHILPRRRHDDAESR